DDEALLRRLRQDHLIERAGCRREAGVLRWTEGRLRILEDEVLRAEGPHQVGARLRHRGTDAPGRALARLGDTLGRYGPSAGRPAYAEQSDCDDACAEHA